MSTTQEVKISEVGYTHSVKGLRLTLCQNGREVQRVLYLGSTQQAISKAVGRNFKGACYDLAWTSTHMGSGEAFRGYHVPLEVMKKTFRRTVNTAKRDGTGLMGIVKGIRSDLQRMKERKETVIGQNINV